MQAHAGVARRAQVQPLRKLLERQRGLPPQLPNETIGLHLPALNSYSNNAHRVSPLRPAGRSGSDAAHFIYREIPEGIRVTLVRHHRRHPDTGMDRQ